ncbi:MAG: hypothetical protein ACM3QS_16630 [Bacteroidota bacterium]
MNRLRIGILLAGESIPLWVQRLIEKVRSLPEAELDAALLLPKRQAPGALFRAYFDLDRRFFHPASAPWQAGSLPGLPLVLRPPAVEALPVESLHLDILINLALPEVPESLPPLARLGVWSARDAFSRLVPGCAAGWRELLQGDPLTRCQVEVIRAGRPAQIVSQAVLATDPLSVSRSQMRLLWRAASLVPRALRELSLRGEESLFDNARAASPLRECSLPRMHEVAILGARQALRKAADVLRKRFTFEQWMLMAADRRPGEPLRWEDFRPLAPSPDLSRADPFMVQYEGRSHIFVEEFSRRAKRGSIACLSLDERGTVASRATVLERPYHLSYPFTFEHRGARYMIPETAGNRSVELYRCTHFPDRWAFEKMLMQDIRALDATLVEHEGRWWMFANIVEEEGGSAWDALHLFYADEPLSQAWRPHPLNPIVADVRAARPAGRIFLYEGRLYRPSQICTPRYGYGIRLNRIDRLTTTDFAETCVETFCPPEGSRLLGTHTVNSEGSVTLIDVQRRRLKL